MKFPATDADRRAEFVRDRSKIAEEWFGGNEQHAQDALDALPFSTIPGWADLDDVMDTLFELGMLA